MRIELTIDKNYLRSWGVWEGLRELVQNGRDASTEFGGELTIDWYNGNLRIENDNCTMTRDSLLLGRTSKGDRADMIGQFGEGMKLGILALVRQEIDVTIRTGSEVWKPSIQQSDKFNAQVLTFEILTGRENKNRVRVEVACTKEDWDSYKDRFLFLARETKDDRVQTPYGDLLTAPRFQGKIYVKGIYVQTDPKLGFGYNFADAKVDRDRQMIDSYDAENARMMIFNHALSIKPDLMDQFFEMLGASAVDFAALNSYSTYKLSDTAKKGIAQKFIALHGLGTIACSSIEESRELEHLGCKAVVCTPAMKAILDTQLGSADTVKVKLKNEVTRIYSWGDLPVSHQIVFSGAMGIIKKAVSNFTQEKVDVVDFRSPTLMGQHKDGRYLIAKRLLDSRKLTLETLVHEVAHDQGIDGEQGHVAEIERIWSTIVENLLS